MATTSIWLLVLILMAAAAIGTTAITDIGRATEEMQRANYFTFIVLINLAPHQLIQSNITFLMPNDKTLSRNTLKFQNSIPDFLLSHSIPSPLLFDHLQRLPSGSVVPTSKPGLFLNISNGGRRNFFLNNVRITSPNICTGGTSIRCHGIDGVIQPLKLPEATQPPDRHIGTRPPPPQPPSLGAIAESPPPATSSLDPLTNPSSSNPNNQRKSGSRSNLMIKYDFALMKTLTCLIFLAVKLSM